MKTKSESEKQFDLSAEGITISVDGVELTCYYDGSVERVDRRYKDNRLVRTFGSNNARGYKQININGKITYVHRLVYEAFAKNWQPNWRIDHINGCTSDNRPENLRQFETGSENLRAHQNKRPGCSSKYRFVSWSSRDKKWQVQVKENGKTIHGGYFEDEIEAARAGDALAEKHGYDEAAFNRTKHTEV